jgi:hypothetical protein
MPFTHLIDEGTKGYCCTHLIVYILAHHVKDLLYEIPPSTVVGTQDTVNERFVYGYSRPARVYAKIRSCSFTFAQAFTSFGSQDLVTAYWLHL